MCIEKLNLKSVQEYILKMLPEIKQNLKNEKEVKAINLLLLRQVFTEESTIGTLYLNGERVADTLENPYIDNQRNISSIPSGNYKVRLRLARESATRDYLHLLVQEVKDRSYILFHRGNTSSDSRGCILVGLSREQDRVNNSKLAMDLLIKEILILGGENIELTIKDY
tara:strand:+ start:1633 stop:2136 length:504 start_codon:yes stop_codon:yes gene_type:complete